MNDKPKTLEDLVPPMELCKQAAGIVGDGTALVWINWAESFPVNGPYQWSEKWHVAVLSECNQTYPHRAAPAPTLEELLEMIYNIEPDCVMMVQLVANSGNVVYEISLNTQNVYNLLVEIDANPATAALRLLMKVKGVEQ